MKEVLVAALLRPSGKARLGDCATINSNFAVLFRAEIKRVFNHFGRGRQAYLSDEVNEELYKILECSTADRVYIFQFHNGVAHYNGQHAQRFTCTYEIVRDGISRLSLITSICRLVCLVGWLHNARRECVY